MDAEKINRTVDAMYNNIENLLGEELDERVRAILVRIKNQLTNIRFWVNVKEN